MRVLIVYDSFFGNTEQIRRAIGDAIGDALASQAGTCSPCAWVT